MYTPRTDNVGNDSTGAAGHRYSNLVGGTDNPSTFDDANALNVTWHHNWWADNVVERQPRIRFGQNHLYNNLWTSDDNYCVRAGIDAKVLLEGNVFDGVKTPHEFNNTDDQGTSNITSTNNVYSGTSGTQASGRRRHRVHDPVVHVSGRRRLVGPGRRPGGRRPALTDEARARRPGDRLGRVTSRWGSPAATSSSATSPRRPATAAFESAARPRRSTLRGPGQQSGVPAPATVLPCN